MPIDAATLVRIKIQFCEKYLENHTDPHDPQNTREIREYLEEQLELARQILLEMEIPH